MENLAQFARIREDKMSKDSITLSPEHGLNPTMPVCYLCGEEKGEIALTGLAGDRAAKKMGRSDGQMPMRCCIDKEPCDKCQGYMKQGIIIIGVEDGESGDNPKRTGHFAVVTEDPVKEMLEGNTTMLKSVMESRVMFMDRSSMVHTGFLQCIEETQEIV